MQSTFTTTVYYEEFSQLPSESDLGSNQFSSLSYSDISNMCGFELIIDTELSINWLHEAPETYYLCPGSFVKGSEDVGGYRYGFNGMEKDNEVKGKETAMILERGYMIRGWEDG
jgi:hypothetical protein